MKNPLLLASIILLGVVSGVDAQTPSDVKITKVSVAPLKMSDGLLRQEVLVEWKNVGKKPVYAIQADIKPIGIDGNVLRRCYYFTATDNGDRPVLPGQSFRTRPGSGVRLKPSYRPATSAIVRTTRVETMKPQVGLAATVIP